jgi:hypothetical protein
LKNVNNFVLVVFDQLILLDHSNISKGKKGGGYLLKKKAQVCKTPIVKIHVDRNKYLIKGFA